MQRADSLEKTLMLGKIKGRRRRGWHHQLKDMILSKLQGIVKDWCWSWSSNTFATWWELTHWERLKARGEEEKMAGWHHRPNGLEFEQTTGNSEGQGSLACWSPWGCKSVKNDLATEQQQSMRVLLRNQFLLEWLHNI